MNILMSLIVLILSVGTQNALSAPVAADLAADLVQVLTPLKTVGDLKTEVLKSTRGPFAEFFEAQFKGHEAQQIEIRRLQKDEFILRVENKLVTIEFRGVEGPVLINKRPVEINWNGHPAEEFKKIQDAFPKQAWYAPGVAPVMMQFAIGSEAHAISYALVLAVGAAVVAVSTNYYRCIAIEESAKTCERFEKMSSEERESNNMRQFASEIAKKYAVVLSMKHLFCSQEKTLKACLKRRGFDVDLIQTNRGSEEQMRGESSRPLSQ